MRTMVKNTKQQSSVSAREAYTLLAHLLLALLAFAVIIQIGPHIEEAPRVDSSIFVYIGDRVLEGAIPYRDVWDHKGPLIYYIDAIGLAVADGSRWGVWFMELAAVVSAALISFSLFKRAFGVWPALFASTLFVLELRLVLDKGNLTEEYALPFQFLLLWLILRVVEYRRPIIYLAIGVLAAMCFLLRPNIVGIPLALGLMLLWQGLRAQNMETLRDLALIAVGGLLVIGLVAIYFYAAGALTDLWDAVFTFNFAYNAEGEGSQWTAFRTGFEKLPLATTVGVVGWLIAAKSLSSSGMRSAGGVVTYMIVLGLPVEMALTTLSGFYFTHYYMSWLPVLALAAAYALQFLSNNLGSVLKVQPNARISAAVIAIFLIILFFVPVIEELWPNVETSLKMFQEAGGLPEFDLTTRAWAPVIDYATENTDPDQPLLVLGNEVKINWLAERDPPIRFVYQTPLLVDGYMSPEKAEALIEELEANPPTIIDTGPPGGFMPSLDTPLDELPPDLRPLYRYFQENYAYAGTFNSIEWDLYLYHGEGEPIGQWMQDGQALTLRVLGGMGPRYENTYWTSSVIW